MASKRIAVLFDAENINCETAERVLYKLQRLGTVQIKRAVGDFSTGSLTKWIACGTANGIDLVLQQGLGKGKNSADIRLAIEAMDIAHAGRVNAVALVSRDRDFTPLALRLRGAGFVVLGYAQAAPNSAFAAACSSFEVLGSGLEETLTTPEGLLTPYGFRRLRDIVAEACKSGLLRAAALQNAIKAAEPKLLPPLGGKGKFQKTLVALGLVEIVGSGADQRLGAKPKQQVA